MVFRFKTDPKIYMEITRHLLRVFGKRFVYVYVDGIKISEMSVELSLSFFFLTNPILLLRNKRLKNFP